jgi:hypothetical protein
MSNSTPEQQRELYLDCCDIAHGRIVGPLNRLEELLWAPEPPTTDNRRDLLVTHSPWPVNTHVAVPRYSRQWMRCDECFVAQAQGAYHWAPVSIPVAYTEVPLHLIFWPEPTKWYGGWGAAQTRGWHEPSRTLYQSEAWPDSGI